MQINDNVSVQNIDLTKSGPDKSSLSWEKEYWDKQVMQTVEGQEFKKSDSKVQQKHIQRDDALLESTRLLKEAKPYIPEKVMGKTLSSNSNSFEKNVSPYRLQPQVNSWSSGMVTDFLSNKSSDNGIKVYQRSNTNVNPTSALKKHLILEKEDKARVFTSQGEQTQSYRQKLAEAMSFFGLKLQTLIVRGKEL